ncbi:MAG TPA: hypothetical protein VF314_09165 [Actinomycetes bacterium]
MDTVLTVDELDRTTAELLPLREALALFNIANITAINLSIAVNAASINAAATSMAGQQIASLQR